MEKQFFIVKEVVTITVSVVCGKGIQKVLVCTTELDPNGIPVVATGTVGGFLIANRLRNKTDAIVDYVAPKMIKIRKDMIAKKDNAQTETP